MVNYGAEGLGAGRTHELYLINTSVNGLGSGAFFDVNAGGTAVIALNNIFAGNGTLFAGKQPQASATNLRVPTTSFVDPVNYNYRLSSAATRDNGVDPGTGGGMSLLPVWQYRDSAQREERIPNGTIDSGAYEY